VTDADGDAYIQYVASEFGGKYEVSGTSDAATPAADTITVGIPLEALGAGTHYGFIGATPEHPVNHFGTPTMNSRLGTFANQLFEEAGVNVEFNDIGLPLGGRFEVADPTHPAVAWDNPAHCDHRWGRGADLRTNTFQDGYSRTNPSPTVRRMLKRWKVLNADWPQVKLPSGELSLPYFWEGDHLHLKTVT
jgi:hypothetical protein